ncbi:hypothetical protein ACLKA6_003417 [Drosophila palustris]
MKRRRIAGRELAARQYQAGKAAATTRTTEAIKDEDGAEDVDVDEDVHTYIEPVADERKRSTRRPRLMCKCWDEWRVLQVVLGNGVKWSGQSQTSDKRPTTDVDSNGLTFDQKFDGNSGKSKS